jgi:hypothetical protein
MRHTDSSGHGKISAEFAERLACLPPYQRVRAVIMPAPYMVSRSAGNQNGNGHGSSHGSPHTNSYRVRGEERQALIRETRTRSEETFAEVDAVLARTGGQRLTESGNALGFIVVETTADGVEALSELGWVGSVIEDQPVRPPSPPSPPSPPVINPQEQDRRH